MKLSKKQEALLERLRRTGDLVVNGFEGEHSTARSLRKRGLVTMVTLGSSNWSVRLNPTTHVPVVPRRTAYLLFWKESTDQVEDMLGFARAAR